MSWYKFVRPAPRTKVIKTTRYYIEEDNKKNAITMAKLNGMDPDWFDSEVDASEVPTPESTCSLEEKFRPEGLAEAFVIRLDGSCYFAEYWSHDGFVVAGFGFMYDATNNVVSDVCASNPEGRQFEGNCLFDFIVPGYDLSMHQDESLTTTLHEFDNGIKSKRTAYLGTSEGLPDSVFYTFWSEDLEIIMEHNDRLSLIAYDMQDLMEKRDEILGGYVYEILA